jgi:hypothetical protein
MPQVTSPARIAVLGPAPYRRRIAGIKPDSGDAEQEAPHIENEDGAAGDLRRFAQLLHRAVPCVAQNNAILDVFHEVDDDTCWCVP